MSAHANYIGRFAPSPTGPLHLGSLAAALGSFLDAKVHQGQWLLRIEDIDEGRCDAASVEHIVHTLKRHGLQWQSEVWVQSQRHAVYQAALKQLQDKNLTYPCACTRKEIDEANSHRAPGENRIYPGTCRHGMPVAREARAIRFRCPAEPVQWHDHRLGQFSDDLNTSSGDFVLKRGDGFWAYHLVVVVDDLASKVTHIVRGEDLTDTTARQIALWQALQSGAHENHFTPPPAYWHLPVILAADGQKLSKQTGALAVPEHDPVPNLNTVWQHFGLGKIKATAASQWLELATPVWANYRSAQAAR
ncbi:MAG: tRNA glutamyl-Q(34) synthetase GluQRS [Gammaproteobacteria bacterium]|nr:tRNA glutamyl-Q(34) synthetase GluQRS [Gammaproteobacteria bacterium]MBU0848044.1 tRNA glutamyl-Q(34) synthetase GluQRS [Gammaproteobacteria bacterium]MBU1266335.1 tRNA glutamyl-Q(34) synthetase GluQRS [Gammaproteobacteria bacterium]MBU1529944.1 tRNA glutamyl-Q(34) synthetase GluQRS [Gammaproteobacteria bacterium]MBU1779919.1 tRNA glutamyl-Q(34) synthetase GluQRS [Gammaproteobacteria bacterium]